MDIFERKFGIRVRDTVPACSGVYRFLDKCGTVIYVGKSNNLKRRLQEYARARCGKMRKIVKAGTALEWDVVDSEFGALCRELELIRELRPRLNVFGKFSHRYPYIGLRQISVHEWSFALSTRPHELADHRWYGCFRSAQCCRNAFDALGWLLGFVGHPTRLRRTARSVVPRYCSLRVFRRIPDSVSKHFSSYLLGESPSLIEALFDRLLELGSARANRSQAQQHFDALRDFWKHEAVRLAGAICAASWRGYPVEQQYRDVVFLLAKQLDRPV